MRQALKLESPVPLFINKMRSLSLFSIILASLISFATFTTAQEKGTITSPTAGTKIQPGQSFPFAFRPHQDYCVCIVIKLLYR